MPAWLIWVIAAGVLAAAETLTLTFVLVMVAAGALGGGAAAAAGLPVAGQFLVAGAVTVAGVAFVRPIAQRHLAPSGQPMNSAALIGREAIVLAETDAHGGRIKLNGSEWSARSLHPADVLHPGTAVWVAQIVGATAIVYAE